MEKIYKEESRYSSRGKGKNFGDIKNHFMVDSLKKSVIKLVSAKRE